MGEPPEDASSAPAADPQGVDSGRVAWTSSTYFAEGLPWSILHQVAAEYMTAIGLRPAQVGYTAFLHATISLKLIWSPIVDLFGTLRSWMIGMQALMGIALGLVAVIAHRVAIALDSTPDASTIWMLLVLIGVLSAMHDIACDGYYMDALDEDDQARYSGLRVAAFRAAMLVGSSGLVFLGGSYNWLLGFGAAAAIMIGLALAHRIWLPHGRSESGARTGHAAAATPKGWSHVKDAYLSFLTQDKVVVVVLFVLTYKMADVLMFSMSKVLLDRELGVTTDLRGILNTFSIGASIVGAIIGGAWITRRSLGRTLITITLLMALTEPLYVAMAALAPELAVSVPGQAETMADIDMAAATWKLVGIGLVIVIEQFCGGLATAAQMVFIMRRCHPDHKAAHFAFATAIYSIPQMGFGGVSGHVYEIVGSVNYFWIVSALTIPAVVLSRMVPTHPRRS